MRNRKLRLELDHLSVESFSVDPAEALLRGTVKGAATNYLNPSECDPSFCVQASCDFTYCANNISCLAPNCGSGGNTLPGQETCRVACTTNPPPIE